MKNIKLQALVLAVLFLCAPLLAAQTLFIIERSKNANIVRYDAEIGADGRIDKKNPVDSYWVLNAADGRREEITSFQKRAYGFSVKYNESGWFDMKMRAVKDRGIKISLVNGEPKAEILINGKNAYLSKIYIDSKDNFAGIPTVNYYTLTGNDVETGEELTEKVAV